MKRKHWLWLFALLAIALLAFFTLAPGIVERGMNKVIATTLPTVTPQTRRLHATLQIADLHEDTLLWKRDLLTRSDQGQVDLPRLQAGNVALQIFSSVTKTPKGQNYDANGADTDNITLLTVAQLQPPRTWTSLLERSLWHATKLLRASAKSDDQLRVIGTPAGLDELLRIRDAPFLCFHNCRKSRRTGPLVGALLSIEGLHNMEGKLANLDRLHAAGYRMASLTHFFDNELAGSMHGIAKGGLTPLGRATVRRMERLGMIVDIAHASHRSVAEILAMAKRPVVSSHGGVQAVCKVNRNLTDAEIRGVARAGGVIGIGYWDAAICGTQPAQVAAAIQHVRDLVGIDHVGLGSDFDGAVATGFDTAQLVYVTQALVDRGFTPEEIRKVMGGNALRVLRAGIAPGR